MAAKDSLLRQILILKSLSQKRPGPTVRDLVDEHGVEDKTIRRDLEHLKSIGFPLEEIVGPRGRKTWQISDENKRLPPITLNHVEALAMYLANHLLEPFANTVLWGESRNALRKIRAGLPADVVEYAERIAGIFHFTDSRAAKYGAAARLIDDLQQAIENCQVTLLSYHPQHSTEPVTYEVDPLAWLFHRGSLYLLARVTTAGIQQFKVDRMLAADLQELRFQRDNNFNVSDYLAGSFGIFVEHDGEPATVQILFAQRVARYVRESRWHPSQQLTDQKDGSVIAEFSLSNTRELKSWLLGFGSAARVLSPPELITEIQSELEQTLHNYTAATKPGSKNPREK